MRTIELTPEHRARILELAASRGEKGFSKVIAEALDLYFEARKQAIPKCARARGSMNKTDAAQLLASTRSIRSNRR